MNERKEMTDAQFRARICRALREVWQATTRADFIRKIRRPNRGTSGFKNIVRCVECDETFGQTEKRYGVKVDGSRTKKMKLAYQVDHVHGIHPLKTLDDLSQHAKDLFHGKQQILCLTCHNKKTFNK